MLGTELVAVLELSDDGEWLTVAAGAGWRPGVVGQWKVPVQAGSQSDFTLGTTGAVRVQDLATEHRFAATTLLVEHDAVSGIGVRIGSPDKPLGTITAFTTRPDRFTRDDAHFLDAVAAILASALARLEAEHELRDSRDELAAVFASVSEGITVQDASGHCCLPMMPPRA